MAGRNFQGTTVDVAEAEGRRRTEHDRSGNKMPRAFNNENMAAKVKRGNNDNGMAKVLDAKKRGENPQHMEDH